MNWQRAIPTSRSIAIAVTLVTVLIMLTPLRRGPASSQRQAGWMPLLNLGGMHDTAAFQRRQVSISGFAASDTPPEPRSIDIISITHSMSSRFKPPGQCPVCGEWAPKGPSPAMNAVRAKKSGWSGDTHADGLDLPDDEFDYDDFIAREFGGKSSKTSPNSNLWWWVALALLIAFMLAALLPLFG